VKNQQKTISNEEKLDLKRQLEKGAPIVDICLNVSFAHSSVRSTSDIADRIAESTK
jgi:cobalamin-dependent methionine synthase I